MHVSCITPHNANTPMYLAPLKPQFYIVKQGFAGVCIISNLFALKHRLWDHSSESLNTPVSTIYVLNKNKKKYH